MTQRGLGAFNERLSHVRNSERNFVGGDDSVVYNRGKMKGDIILRHTDLTGHFGYLDLDIHRPQVLAERVYPD